MFVVVFSLNSQLSTFNMHKQAKQTNSVGGDLNKKKVISLKPNNTSRQECRKTLRLF